MQLPQTDPIDDSLTCSICCMRFVLKERNPVVIPCGHTFCALCVKGVKGSCPICREGFSDAQVKKNFNVQHLVEIRQQELQQKKAHDYEEERCAGHKREIDRYCKLCAKLMCSVCHCSHLGSMNLISDINLREEIESIVKSYEDFDDKMREVEQRIDDYADDKRHAIQSKQDRQKDEMKENTQIESQKVSDERDGTIKAAEEDAILKIQLIEENKQKLINQAHDDANKKLVKIRQKEEDLFKKLESEGKSTIDAARKKIKDLKKEIDTFENLSKHERSKLDDCLAIYKIQENQNSRLKKFLGLNASDIEEFLNRNAENRREIPNKDQDNLRKFAVGECVDCWSFAANKPLNAVIREVQDKAVKVHYSDWSESWDEWIEITSPRLLKQWRKGDEFQVNNRIDVFYGYGWHEAYVVEIGADKINVYFRPTYEGGTLWISKDSEAIAQVGSHSDAFGEKRH